MEIHTLKCLDRTSPSFKDEHFCSDIDLCSACTSAAAEPFRDSVNEQKNREEELTKIAAANLEVVREGPVVAGIVCQGVMKAATGNQVTLEASTATARQQDLPACSTKEGLQFNASQ
jgi:hypothetical protein